MMVSRKLTLLLCRFHRSHTLSPSFPRPVADSRDCSSPPSSNRLDKEPRTTGNPVSKDPGPPCPVRKQRNPCVTVGRRNDRKSTGGKDGVQKRSGGSS